MAKRRLIAGIAVASVCTGMPLLSATAHAAVTDTDTQRRVDITRYFNVTYNGVTARFRVHYGSGTVVQATHYEYSGRYYVKPTSWRLNSRYSSTWYWLRWYGDRWARQYDGTAGDGVKVTVQFKNKHTGASVYKTCGLYSYDHYVCN